MMDILRPGDGWQRLSGIVWEHTSGSRIHTGGIVRLPDGTHLSTNKWTEGTLGRKLIKINGGNTKRGLMAWVNNILHNNKDKL